MLIELKKFGMTLVSRQAGKEAYAAFLPTLCQAGQNEDILIDFSGVNTFTPSWGDEFLTPLKRQMENRVKLLHADENASVRLTLEFLEQLHSKKS
ncbi:MAG: DUF4325 domain-containing protein [bacterium]|nr:DUF4325 domain-containing protein [bacterium]